MEKVFQKKIFLTTEEKLELNEEIHSGIYKVKEFEQELSSLDASYKSTKKMIEKDINLSVSMQRTNLDLITDGFRTVEVECQEFFDRDITKVIVLEITNGELLNVKGSSSYSGKMPVDYEPINTVDSMEALVALFKKNINSYGEPPICAVDVNIEDRIMEYFVFRDTDERLALLRNTYEAFPTEDSFQLSHNVIVEAQTKLHEELKGDADIYPIDMLDDETPFNDNDQYFN